jgi:hypothetical protein
MIMRLGSRAYIYTCSPAYLYLRIYATQHTVNSHP